MGSPTQSAEGKKIWLQEGQFTVKSTLEWTSDVSEAKFTSEVL